MTSPEVNCIKQNW